MALLKRVKDISKVDTAWRKHYKKEGDWYVLQTSAADDDDADEDPAPDPDDADEDPAPSPKGKSTAKAKIKEFRDKNVELLRKVEELEGKLAGIDPDMIEAGSKALKQAKNEEERKLLQSGDLKGVVDLRVAELKDAHKKELDKLNKSLSEATSARTAMHEELAGIKIGDYIMRGAAKAKLQIEPTAHDDLVRRGREVFKLDAKGKVVALDEDGQARLNAEQEEYGLTDFFQDVSENAPHLLGRANGGDVGAGGGRGRVSGGRGQLEVDANDPKAFGKNLEKIASGEITARVKGMG